MEHTNQYGTIVCDPEPFSSLRTLERKSRTCKMKPYECSTCKHFHESEKSSHRHQRKTGHGSPVEVNEVTVDQQDNDQISPIEQHSTPIMIMPHASTAQQMGEPDTNSQNASALSRTETSTTRSIDAANPIEGDATNSLAPSNIIDQPHDIGQFNQNSGVNTTGSLFSPNAEMVDHHKALLIKLFDGTYITLIGQVMKVLNTDGEEQTLIVSADPGRPLIESIGLEPELHTGLMLVPDDDDKNDNQFDKPGAPGQPELINTAENSFDKPNTPVVVDVDANDTVGAVQTDNLRSSESTVAIFEPVSIKSLEADSPSEIKTQRNQHIPSESHSWQSEKPKSSKRKFSFTSEDDEPLAEIAHSMNDANRENRLSTEPRAKIKSDADENDEKAENKAPRRSAVMALQRINLPRIQQRAALLKKRTQVRRKKTKENKLVQHKASKKSEKITKPIGGCPAENNGHDMTAAQPVAPRKPSRVNHTQLIRTSLATSVDADSRLQNLPPTKRVKSNDRIIAGLKSPLSNSAITKRIVLNGPIVQQQQRLAQNIRIKVPQPPLRHPAPLPAPPVSVNNNSLWKRTLPRPFIICIENASESTVITWRMDLSTDHDDIASYQIYSYQETAAAPSSEAWHHVDDVRALPLPMSVKLTQLQDGQCYYFAVRAVDIRGQPGPFSFPQAWGDSLL